MGVKKYHYQNEYQESILRVKTYVNLFLNLKLFFYLFPHVVDIGFHPFFY